LTEFGDEVQELVLIPSSGGVYEISRDGNLIFSKKEMGRFPETDHEILSQLT